MVKLCEVTSKIRFDEQAAEQRAQQLMDERNVSLSTYKCPYCYSWHLTSQQKAS